MREKIIAQITTNITLTDAKRTTILFHLANLIAILTRRKK